MKQQRLRVDFGDTLRKKRLEVGLTQGTLARQAEVSQQIVNALEHSKGTGNPCIKTLFSLCNCLDLSLLDLLAGVQ